MKTGSITMGNGRSRNEEPMADQSSGNRSSRRQSGNDNDNDNNMRKGSRSAEKDGKNVVRSTEKPVIAVARIFSEMGPQEVLEMSSSMMDHSHSGSRRNSSSRREGSRKDNGNKKRHSTIGIMCEMDTDDVLGMIQRMKDKTTSERSARRS
jgi:hypothetical protein